MSSRKMLNYLLLLCFLSIVYSSHAPLKAHFDQNNIRGAVHFMDVVNSTNITIKVELTVPSNTELGWKILQYPAAYSPSCNVAGLGSTIQDLTPHHGAVNPNRTYTDNILKVSGKDSVFGRSLVLYSKDNLGQYTVVKACANILSSSQAVSYYKAVISNNIVAGSFEFMKIDDSVTMIYGEVSHSDGKVSTSNGHSWYIYKQDSSLACKNLNETFNPLNGNSTCTNAQESSCMVGDLTSKFGTINIGSGGNQLFFGIDTQISLTGASSIYNQYLVIKSNSNNSTIGCAQIKDYGPLNVHAVFNSSKHQGVVGNVSFTQPSPYHATKLEVNLDGLANRTSGYYIYQFPISNQSNSCSVDSVGGHLNPHQIIPANSPAPNAGSVDKYEVGDLSGKFGSLTNLSSLTFTTLDLSLPLYGMNTIIGRSVVIQNGDASSSRFVCESIQPQNARTVLSGLVNLATIPTSGLSGTVHVKQFIQTNGVKSPTIFVLTVNHKANPNLKTNSHNFHVHVSPIQKVNTGICSSALGHYNPTNVVLTKPAYNTQCNAKHLYRCEVGDTSSKVGTYNIGNGKTLFADSFTPLDGDYTSLGRSIVFHAANRGAPRIGCGDVIPDPATSDVFRLELDIEDKSLKNDVDSIKDSVLKALEFPKTDLWKLNYFKSSNSTVKDTCFHVTLYVLEKDTPQLRDLIQTKIKNDQIEHFKMCKSQPSSSSYSSSSIFFVIVSTMVAYVMN